MLSDEQTRKMVQAAEKETHPIPGLARIQALSSTERATLVAEIQTEGRKPWIVRRFRWAQLVSFRVRRFLRL